MKDSQRAGGIEANASDVAGVDVMLVDGTLDGDADCAPDVGSGLFLVNAISTEILSLKEVAEPT